MKPAHGLEQRIPAIPNPPPLSISQTIHKSCAPRSDLHLVLSPKLVLARQRLRRRLWRRLWLRLHPHLNDLQDSPLLPLCIGLLEVERYGCLQDPHLGGWVKVTREAWRYLYTGFAWQEGRQQRACTSRGAGDLPVEALPLLCSLFRFRLRVRGKDGVRLPIASCLLDRGTKCEQQKERYVRSPMEAGG